MSHLNPSSPARWATEPLGELCDIVIGRTPSRSNPGFWNGSLPWVSISDMRQGNVVSTTKELITPIGASESRSRLVAKGTILLSFKLTIGKVSIAGVDLYTNEAIAALPIRDSRKLNRDYLYWCLQSIRLDEEVDVAAKGKTLNSKKLARIAIPLPPLDEQRRIAAVLEKADALHRQRQESLQLTEKLLQSVFLDMFGDPATNPMDWDKVPLEQLCERIVDCPHSTPAYSERSTGFYCVRSSDIQRGKLNLATARHVSKSVYQDRIARHEPQRGEVIYTREGGRLGFAAQVPAEKTICLGQRMMLFAGKKGLATNTFLANLLNAESFRRIVLNLAGGGAAPRVNIKDLRTLDVYVPPFELQERFSVFSVKLDEEEEAIQESAQLTEDLLASVQQRAFRGELDLSRLRLAPDTEPPVVAPVPQRTVVEGRYTRPGSFIAPVDIEQNLLALEEKLEDDPAEPITWSEDFFKYRTLSQILQPPFSFAKIWTAVEQDFDQPHYDTVKDKVFEYVVEGILEQQFDEEKKEIVFRPKT